jgi:CBS domain-containing protein
VAIAYMLSSYGIFWAVWTRGRDLLTAVWMLLIGFFLKNAAENDYRHRERQRAGEQAEQRRRERWDVAGTVGAVMSAPPVSVSPDLRVSEFIDRILARHRHTSFPVARDGRLYGILSLARLRETPCKDWEQLAVRDVMEPVDDSLFVPVRASIEHAARKLKANRLDHLAVVDGDGLLIGYLSAADLERVA